MTQYAGVNTPTVLSYKQQQKNAVGSDTLGSDTFMRLISESNGIYTTNLTSLFLGPTN
jgi:hypothetical protein